MTNPLTLDQLHVLIAVADSGSFSAAGRRLGRVQSAISQTIRTLETIQGVVLFDRSGHRPRLTPFGRALLGQARLVVAGAARFEAMAVGARTGLEAELSVVIDPFVPTELLIDSLRALRDAFPDLSVSFWTEGVGGAERRLADGTASLGVCLLVPDVPPGLTAHLLMTLDLVPVVAPGHPLARLDRPLDRDDLEAHVQLVLSYPQDREGQAYGVVGSKLWRFVDLGRRLDFLLAGFGWCKMPRHLVAPLILAGGLRQLAIPDEGINPSGGLRIYAAHARGTRLGRAGTWLLADLRRRAGRHPVATLGHRERPAAPWPGA